MQILFVNWGEKNTTTTDFKWNSGVVNVFSRQHTYLDIFKLTSEEFFFENADLGLQYLKDYIAY